MAAPYNSAIVPVTFSRTVGTAATRLSTAALLVQSFVVSNHSQTVRVYVGDSNVSSTRGIIVGTNGTASFPLYNLLHTCNYSYDLNEWYARATVASQTVSVTYFRQFGG